MKRKKMSRKEEILSTMKEIYGELSPEERIICFGMLEEAAFLKVTLEGLRAEIEADGCTDEYKNGANQFGRKVSASLQSYNQTLKNYYVLMEKITKMFPLGATEKMELLEMI